MWGRYYLSVYTLLRHLTEAYLLKDIYCPWAVVIAQWQYSVNFA